VAVGGTAVDLVGRREEQQTLDQLLRDVRDGQSRTLVLRGEAGAGKTALLDHLARRAAFARVLRASGVESESEIAYSALQQLCAPLLGHLDALPEAQRAALETAFGLSPGPAAEKLFVGLAVLGLLSEAAAERPLVCIVDDVQWIDAMSAVILGFVARRVDAEAIALVFAARSPGDDQIPPGLPELAVTGLAPGDARALLDLALTGPVDERVRDQIVAETRGNPMALRELPRGMSPAELAFGFGGYDTAPPASRVEEGYRRRIAALPADTRTVLLAAAAEPTGDVPLLWRALDRLDVSQEAAARAEAERLIEFGTRVRFPHPLVRSAAWRSGTAVELRTVHAALADVTDPAADPDRRVWHRAHAALGPDDEVAAELEGSAERALARGGRSTAAAFLERAAELSGDPRRRGALLVSAAAARAEAGAFAQVTDLLSAAELAPLDQLQQARAERLRAQVAFMLRHGREAGPPLLAAARRLQDLDPAAARDTFLLAIGAAMYAGRFGGDDLRAAAEAARAAGPAGTEPPDLLLAGHVSWILDGRTAAVPLLNRALDASDFVDAGLVWLTMHVAYDMLRLDVADRITDQAVSSVRAAGALSLLPNLLALRAICLVNSGRLADAAEALVESDALTQVTGATVYQVSRLVLAAYRGPEQQALGLIDTTLRDAVAGGNGRVHTLGNGALAILHNGLGDHRSAMAAAQESIANEAAWGFWGPLGELVEAAVRAGEPAVAASARDSLAERTAATPTPTARGLQALADALVDPAERRYREAIDLLNRPETALLGHRARLLLGEWLRREGRRDQARVELRAAHRAFSAAGADVYADRAARELAAAGETVRSPAGARAELTPQEAAIAQLAGTGRTNPEIGAALFLSPRTVEWHLRKIFTKLGIASRRELATALRQR
jgi:DNA-binding CsgD family transcriptional regulator